MTNRYVHGDQVDEPWVQYESAAVGSSNWRFLHADHQGSIIARSTAVGALHGNALSYDSYGIPKSTNQGRLGYTGQAWLKELGLFHYKARVYHPKLGRFLQTDPIFYADQMNMYAYAYNDPVNVIDPSGMNGARVAGMLGEEVLIEVAIQVATGQPIDLTTATRSAAEGIINPLKKFERLQKLYLTYTKAHLKDGTVYSGRASGYGTPEQIMKKRDSSHHMNKKGYGPGEIDKVTDDAAANRGREQQLIEANGGAQSTGGTSGNAINGVSQKESNRSNREKFEDAAKNAVWRNCDGALSVDCSK